MIKEMAKALMEVQYGKIFSVTFKTKDGNLKKVTGRLGVISHEKGGVNTVAHIPKYVTVFDMHKQGYRNVNLETVREIRHKNISTQFYTE